jgi:hypothetical protein
MTTNSVPVREKRDGTLECHATKDEFMGIASFDPLTECRAIGRFIDAAIAHRHWLTSEASRIAGSADCENTLRAISGAIRELDQIILRTNLESEKTSFPCD